MTTRSISGSGSGEASLPPSIGVGAVIGGKYRVDRICGTGGMGVVVEARHLQLDLPIAIKFMSPMLRDNSHGVSRFMLEARATAHIHCEHVVRVFDVASLEDGTPYIVMEYLEGEDLGEMLLKRGRLPVAEAVDYVLQACEGIAEAHAMGIVHRDLKPGNLFWCSRPHGAPLVKVVDFGISMLLSEARAGFRSERTTGPHVMLGSPAYSSPEQLHGACNVDGRADVWALGAVLYELVAGTPPFAADTFMGICSKVMWAEPEPLGVLYPEVTPELEAVIGRSLAKDRDRRFATVGELAEAMAPFATRRTPVSLAASLPSQAATSARATSRRRVSRPRAVLWCVVSAAMAAFLAAWASVASRGGSPEVATSSVAQAAVATATSFMRPSALPSPEADSEVRDGPAASSISTNPATTATAPAEVRRPSPPPADARLRPKKVTASITATR
jgi:serine/threonine-protein kinase